MAKYITKQRKIFLHYLELHPDELLTAKQIAEALDNDSISLSAVYRNLSDLESEGKIHRISRSGTREVYYQYTDADRCKTCLHLRCKKCGKTFHMGMLSVAAITENLKQNEKFTIDNKDTVIYGVCGNCIE
ncbi:MAG: transcriptional repressor [Clostridia bacterium]|nr:transcriptional repressor [Clostridia bacterium]